jgi:hypothetical protein
MREMIIETIGDYRERLSLKTELNESTGKSNLYLDGIWGQSELWNGNNRWYQLKEMDSEVGRHNKDLIPIKKCVGELDHSSESCIMLSRSSHIFENLRMDGNNMIGRAKVMDTIPGLTLRALCEEGVPFGVSTKAMGVLSPYTRDGKKGNLVSDFELTSPGDVVYDQSAPNAIPKIIYERMMQNEKLTCKIIGEELTEALKKEFGKYKSTQMLDKYEVFWNRLININIK